MKIGIKLLIAAGIGLVTLVVVVMTLWLSADTLLKTAIEKIGPDLLGAPVTVKDIRLTLESGKGSIEGLVVDNPAGFRSASAIRLGKVDLAIDAGTAMQDVVSIKRIAIEGPEITYERRGETSNLDTLKHNVDRYLKDLSEGQTSGPKHERKFIVDELTIRRGKVNLSAGLPVGSSVSVALPAIQLRDIGRKTGGVTPAELTRLVTSAITTNSARVAAATLDRVRRDAANTLGSLRDIFH